MQKFRYLVVLNQEFLTQIATGLIPQNDYVLLRISINTPLKSPQCGLFFKVYRSE